jgi:hypothetical protein
VEVVDKPHELLALHGVTSELFGLLKSWFDVGDAAVLDLRAIDTDEVVRSMSDPVMIAALAMRKLQALHLIATPGVRTSTDVVITVVQDLARALVQAPTMRLQVRHANVDWDAELALLDTLLDSDTPHDAAPQNVTDVDEDAEYFNALHAQLHVAVEAVLRVSDGEIAYLE